MVQYSLPVASMETMTHPAVSRLKSFASLAVLPILLLVLLFALGRGLDGIIAEGKASIPGRARHVNASPAAFGTQRAMADRAAELADGELN